MFVSWLFSSISIYGRPDLRDSRLCRPSVQHHKWHSHLAVFFHHQNWCDAMYTNYTYHIYMCIHREYHMYVVGMYICVWSRYILNWQHNVHHCRTLTLQINKHDMSVCHTFQCIQIQSLQTGWLLVSAILDDSCSWGILCWVHLINWYVICPYMSNSHIATTDDVYEWYVYNMCTSTVKPFPRTPESNREQLEVSFQTWVTTAILELNYI